ncbi:MAG: hypothetical protein M0040_04035 [Actinomycetota bacterium]|nr:hypothetical protein [Actinomycetota bacterium]
MRVEAPSRRSWSLVDRLAARSLALVLVGPVPPVGDRAEALLRLAGQRPAVLELAARRVERGAFAATSTATGAATGALRLAAHLASWRLDEQERDATARYQPGSVSVLGPEVGPRRRELV